MKTNINMVNNSEKMSMKFKLNIIENLQFFLSFVLT